MKHVWRISLEVLSNILLLIAGLLLLKKCIFMSLLHLFNLPYACIPSNDERVLFFLAKRHIHSTEDNVCFIILELLSKRKQDFQRVKTYPQYIVAS